MADPLSFEALASSDYVLSSAENFVLYVLLEAVARGAGGGGRLPLNLGVVIDRSGSMYDERRLEFVVDAVKFLADSLTAEDKVSIVAFADKAKVIVTPEEARDQARSSARSTISICSKSAAAPRWRSGCARRSTRSRRISIADRLNRVLVLTDGQTYEETACIDLVEQNRDQISFSTMGVGVEFNEKLAAAPGAGFQRQISLHRRLRRDSNIFEDELQGLRSVTVAQRANRCDALAGRAGARGVSRLAGNLRDGLAAGRRRSQDQLRDRRSRRPACPAPCC